MKSLCIVIGFTLLLAAACGVTLIGDGGGCSGRRLFRACPHDPAAAAPAKPVMASTFSQSLPGTARRSAAAVKGWRHPFVRRLEICGA